MIRTTAVRQSKTEARQELKAKINMAIDAFKAITEEDFEVRYEAAQRVVSIVSNADFVTPADVDLAKAYLNVNKDLYNALQFDKAWQSLPERLAAVISRLVASIQKGATRLNEVLAVESTYPESALDALQQLSFKTAAELNVYRHLLHLVNGINKHNSHLATREKFDLIHEEVNDNALRLGRSQCYCSTSLIHNHVEECVRVAWFNVLNVLRRFEMDYPL